MKTAIIAGMCFMMVFFNHGVPTSSDAGTACTVSAGTKQAAVPAVNRLKAVELTEEKEAMSVIPAAYAAIEPASSEPQAEDRSQLRLLKPVHGETGENADSYASGKQSHLLQAMMR